MGGLGVTCPESRLRRRRRATSGSSTVRRCGSQTEDTPASTLSLPGLIRIQSAPPARPLLASLSTEILLELHLAGKRRTWDRDVQTPEESHSRMWLSRRKMYSSEREPGSKLPWELLTKPDRLWLQELSA